MQSARSAHAANPTLVVDQAGRVVRDATHAPTGAPHECDTMTTAAKHTTPSQARPASVGGVHPGAAAAGRVFPPLETGVAHYFGDPYHWAATCLMPGKETRRYAYASERVHPYRPTRPPSVPSTDELLRRAAGHLCVHGVRDPCRNPGCKKATTSADPPWTSAGQIRCTKAAAVTPHCRVSHNAFAHWAEGATQLNSSRHHCACTSPRMIRMTPDRFVIWPHTKSPPVNSPT